MKNLETLVYEQESHYKEIWPIQPFIAIVERTLHHYIHAKLAIHSILFILCIHVFSSKSCHSG